jgi:hypothetical protein
MDIDLEWLARLSEAIEAWHTSGNQETEWIEVSLWTDPPQEFLDYEQLCLKGGLGSLLDYGSGCDLLENFQDCLAQSLDPSQGWRFKLAVALNSLSWEQRYRTGKKPFIWEYIARTSYKQTPEECEKFLRQFCISVGEWQKDDRGNFCEIAY